MKIWRKIWRLMRMKNPVEKKTFTSRKKVRTVYGDEELGKQNRRFHNVHFILKYKLLVPALLIVKKWMDRKIGKPDLDKPQFEYLKLWDKAWKEAAAKWKHYYVDGKKSKEGIETVKSLIEQRKSTTKWLMLAHDVHMAIDVNDDAYMEFITFFMHELYKDLTAHFKKHSKDGKHHYLGRNYQLTIDPMYELIYLQLKSAGQQAYAVEKVDKDG